MKIVYYTYLRDKGGAARVANLIASYLSKEPGYEFIQLVEREGVDWSKLKDASIFHLHSSKNWLEVLKKLVDFKGIVFITAHDFQVLGGGCVYPFQCFNWQKECVSCPLGFTNSKEVFAQKKKLLLKINPIFIYPSNWLKKMGSKMYPGLEHKLIYNGVELNFNPTLELFRYQRKFIILICSSLGRNEIKGSDRWPFIIESIFQEDKEIRFFLVGGEKLSFSSPEVAARVKQVPVLPHSELLNLLAQGSLLIYPARIDNFPLVILEGMACGLPVVAYQVGGIGEQVIAGDCGELIAPLAEDKLIATALALLKNPGQLRKMGVQARERWQRFFRIEKMAKEYGKVYVQN